MLGDNLVVCKFGGSSVANAEQIQKVRSIVLGDPRRRCVVVSAPGRDDRDDHKVTDHLFNIASEGGHFYDQRISVSPSESRKAVREKFLRIAQGLDVDAQDLLASLERDFDTELVGDRRTAFLASRGEHYCARLVAAYLCRTGENAKAALPEDIGFEVSSDYLDARVLEVTYENLARLDWTVINVIPGYYGITPEKEVAVFSRGGSDLTGGQIAYALDASLYENWTDVSGVFEADPRIIANARAIPRLTFKEIRLLSSKGMGVLHHDAMVQCRRRKIPIQIRNTNAPQERGTSILNERVPEEGVVGIAKLDGVAYIYLEKDGLSDEMGFTADLLRILNEHGISTYHYPTDKDDLAVVVNQEELKGSINDLRRDIERTLQPDVMDVVYNLAILTPVGLGLKANSYPIVDALQALANEHINIEMIDQSPSQLCFHVGVGQAVANDALEVLYEALIAG